MADMAPMKAYQGSKGTKRVEASKADRKADKRHKEGSRADRRSDRTLIGKHKAARVSRTQTPFGGDDLAGA